MNVYISAPSGVGKTAVTEELARRGYAACDTDQVPGLTRMELRETGEPIDWPKDDIIDWKKYGWHIQGDVLDDLLIKNEKENLFLSGYCGNQPDFYHKFSKLIVLTVDSPEEYLRRQRTRPYRANNDSEAAIQKRLGTYQTRISELIQAGFTPVDNSGTPAQTADKILRMVNEE